MTGPAPQPRTVDSLSAGARRRHDLLDALMRHTSRLSQRAQRTARLDRADDGLPPSRLGGRAPARSIPHRGTSKRFPITSSHHEPLQVGG